MSSTPPLGESFRLSGCRLSQPSPSPASLFSCKFSFHLNRKLFPSGMFPSGMVMPSVHPTLTRLISRLLLFYYVPGRVLGVPVSLGRLARLPLVSCLFHRETKAQCDKATYPWHVPDPTPHASPAFSKRHNDRVWGRMGEPPGGTGQPLQAPAIELSCSELLGTRPGQHFRENRSPVLTASLWTAPWEPPLSSCWAPSLTRGTWRERHCPSEALRSLVTCLPSVLRHIKSNG